MDALHQGTRSCSTLHIHCASQKKCRPLNPKVSQKHPTRIRVCYLGADQADVTLVNNTVMHGLVPITHLTQWGRFV